MVYPHFRPVLYAAVVLVLLAGCRGGWSTPRSDSAGQTPASTPTRTPAPTPVPTLTPTPSPVTAIRALRTVCLGVQAAYEDVEDLPLPPPPAAETVARLLAVLDVQVRAAGESCDANLSLTLTLKPLGDSYSKMGGGGSVFCYTGAYATAEVVLTIPGRVPVAQAGAGRHAPASGIISECPWKPHAPFDDAWPAAVLEALAAVWGNDLYLTALQDDSPAIRVASAAAFAYEPVRSPEAFYGPPDPVSALPDLIRALEADEDSFVRTILVQAVSRAGRTGPEGAAAIPALIATLDDPDPVVRGHAAQGLAQIGPPAIDAVPALIPLLKDEDGFVQSGTEWALREITGEDFGEDAAQWQAWWDSR